MNSLFRLLCKLAILSVMIMTGAGFLGHIHPAFDTFAHFRLHFSVGLLVAVLLLLVMKRHMFALTALMVAAIGIYSALPGTVVAKRNLAGDTALQRYSLFHFNLLWTNRNKQAVIENIRRLDPDIITVVEQSTQWRRLFPQLHDVWPHQFQCRKNGQRNATTIYSKWPFVEGSSFCGVYSSFANVDVIAPGGKRITLGAAHMRWPWPASGPKQLKTLAPDLKKLGENVLVAGDFNATTWSWAVNEFARAGGMEIVPGIGPTWVADKPLVKSHFWAGLPIDNVMEKGKVKVLSAKTLEKMGSDHLPVWVEFQLRD